MKLDFHEHRRTVRSCSWKRLLILLLSLTMIITLMPPSVFAENDSSTDITDSTNTSFSDVKSSDYFYSPVNWAVQNEITEGTSDTTFSPEQGCTRAQAITFLWRLSGRQIVSRENNFDDVKKGDYYAEAVNWAVSRSITKGTGDHKFDPDAICTRAQIVTFLARYKGVSTSAEYPDSGFSDVKKDQYYTQAVNWAVRIGITQGTGSNLFSPDITCTRGQIVSFLFRMAMRGSTITFGSYEQDNDLSNGPEPIEWIVLTFKGNHALIVSKMCLDAIPYNEEDASVTWETCTLRKWLNDTFYNTAFTDSEKTKIIESTIVNEDRNDFGGADGGNDTLDNVFLLSGKEIENPGLAFDNYNRLGTPTNNRPGTPTEYAKAHGANTLIQSQDENSWWWLRSPSVDPNSNDHNYAEAVFFDGSVSNGGLRVDTKTTTVRPALWVELEYQKPITPKDTFTVTFDYNYDNWGTYKTVERKNGEKLGIVEPPIRRGYAFSGWYMDSNLTTPYDYSGSIDSDFTLYAKWVEISNRDMIPDSWEEIIASCDDGTYKEKYKIGDTKELDLGREGIVEMQIAAFDADELADGSGKAAITWISKQLLDSKHRMNPVEIGTIGGWANSEMRSWLQSDVKSLIPLTVRQAIKPVTKYSRSYTENGQEAQLIRNEKSVDDVWIPSCLEVFGFSEFYFEYFDRYESEGPIYPLLSSRDRRIKRHTDMSEADHWRLRSAANEYTFNWVPPLGVYYKGGQNGSMRVVLGFCT